MKTKPLYILAALAALTLAPAAAQAGGASAYWGVMDTKLFGEGDYVGGSLELSILPLATFQLRGGFADNFKEFNIKAPSTAGLSAQEIKLNNDLFGGSGATALQIKDFSVIPLEIGLLGRLPIFGFLSVYGGVGFGYYVVPEFTVASYSSSEYAKRYRDITGYWGVLGIEAGMPMVKLFAEVKYSKVVQRNIEIELEYMGYIGELNANIDLSGPSYLIGVRLQF